MDWFEHISAADDYKKKGGTKKARAHLQKAVEVAANSVELAMTAGYVVNLLGDERWGKEIIQNALDGADEALDLIMIAIQILEHPQLGGRERGTGILRKVLNDYKPDRADMWLLGDTIERFGIEELKQHSDGRRLSGPFLEGKIIPGQN